MTIRVPRLAPPQADKPCPPHNLGVICNAPPGIPQRTGCPPGQPVAPRASNLESTIQRRRPPLVDLACAFSNTSQAGRLCHQQPIKPTRFPITTEGPPLTNCLPPDCLSHLPSPMPQTSPQALTQTPLLKECQAAAARPFSIYKLPIKRPTGAASLRELALAPAFLGPARV